ncbi:hypothetical protein [Variovorax sp. 350MFTsu5.1]|uniref:hypothetical protein n=1 Tax=Variovorax sp. 350MFTsu5.1 TaxID=3158365 RepID=UPI003AACD4C8
MQEQLKGSSGIGRAFELADPKTYLRWDRFVFGDAAFAALRRATRHIAAALFATEDEELADLAARLQFAVAGWLTTPCVFDSHIAGQLRSLLGEAEYSGRRWGPEISGRFVTSIRASEAMASRGSRMRTELAEEVQRLLVEDKDIRIHCRRTDRETFESAVNSKGPLQIGARHFIHSPREYRNSPAFDILVKVGPFRRHGIAGSPDALINAPKFNSIVQFTWDGLVDDADFGADAFDAMLTHHTGAGTSGDDVVEACGFRWHVGTLARKDESGWTLPSDAAGEESDLPDDLDIRPRRANKDPVARSALVRLDRDMGILQPTHADLLCLRKSTSAPGFEADWVECDEVREGMFLVLADVEEAAGASSAAGPSLHAETWKHLLGVSLRSDREGTINRLRHAGIDLAGIANSVDNWVSPSTNVVHAPLSERHFMCLMKVVTELHAEWDRRRWHLAWREVTQSRGEAIVAGFAEHEKLRDRVFATLDLMTLAITEGLATGSDFSRPAPVSSGLRGAFSFRRILGVERGFRAPQREMRHVRPSISFTKWLY